MTETFDVLSADGTATTVTVTITGTNDAPELVGGGGADQLADTDTAFSYDASANFSDVDAGDVLTYSATLDNGDLLPSWLSFDTATGVLSGTPGSGDAATFNVTVTATDLLGANVTDTFALGVADSVVNVITVSGTFDDEVIVDGTSDADAITVDGTFGDEVKVNAKDGDDTITVEGTYADEVKVKGGSGDDEITLDGTFDDEVKIEGGSGDDEITLDGTFGDEVKVKGGSGDDVITLSGTYIGSGGSHGSGASGGSGDYDGAIQVDGGAGADIITVGGTYEDATIKGGSGDDELYGGAGDDTLKGGADDDLLSGGAGDNVIDGGAGTDTALYSGEYNEISIIIEEDGSVTITHDDGSGGTDTLTDVEYVEFADGTVSVADISDGAGGFNQAPVLSGDGELNVSAGGTATITSDDINVVDAEDGAEGITFTLLDDPDFGSLLLDGAVMEEGDTFTQADIDSGLLIPIRFLLMNI